MFAVILDIEKAVEPHHIPVFDNAGGYRLRAQSPAGAASVYDRFMEGFEQAVKNVKVGISR